MRKGKAQTPRKRRKDLRWSPEEYAEPEIRLPSKTNRSRNLLSVRNRWSFSKMDR